MPEAKAPTTPLEIRQQRQLDESAARMKANAARKLPAGTCEKCRGGGKLNAANGTAWNLFEGVPHHHLPADATPLDCDACNGLGVKLSEK